MADMKSGVLSTPTLHELNTLMEKRRSELKQLKEGRLKADHLVNRVRNSFSLENTGTPAAVRTQDGFSTPFYNAIGSSGQVGMLDRRALRTWFMLKGAYSNATNHGLIDGDVMLLNSICSAPQKIMF